MSLVIDGGSTSNGTIKLLISLEFALPVDTVLNVMRNQVLVGVALLSLGTDTDFTFEDTLPAPGSYTYVIQTKAQTSEVLSSSYTVNYNGSIVSISSRQQAFKANTNKGVLIPFYQDPIGFPANTNCANLIALIKKYPQVPISVILNPNSGPGSIVNADYTALIDGLQAAGATVLGYVASGFSTSRTAATITADIDLWRSFYPKIDSIFIDEMSNIVGNEQFYVTIKNYCNSFGLFPVVSNAGTTIPQSYYDAGASDIYIDYENMGYPTEAAISGPYGGTYANFNYNDRAAIAYGVPFDVINLNLMKKYFGLVYVTDTTLPNPYLNTGTYLESVISGSVI